MGIVKSRIKIELQSDLCAGSGYSYAGIIDSDVCYDKYGIPYIPGKRIKGCMRDALETTLYSKYPDVSQWLFGEKGKDFRHGALRVSNAYIANYESICRFLSTEIGSQFDSQRILGRFTRVIGQTALVDGIADPNSLRYTRVVNQYDPCNDGKEMVFYADVSFEDEHGKGDDKKKVKDIVKDILSATRHIGLKRNRGLGVVKCKVESCDMEEVGENDYIIVDPQGDYTTIYYSVENDEPLMLNAEKENESRDYITGKMVIGALASKYINAGGESQSQEFAELFLNGSTKYSHLLPYKDGRIYYPAPEYVNRLKKTKKYVYTVDRQLPNIDESNKDYDYRFGNLPKRLKGKYVNLDNNQIHTIEVKKDITYHHRHKNSSRGEEEILYSVECLMPGQKFAGSIRVKSEYNETIQRLLTEGDLYFGKSRSSQYGRCCLSKFENKPENKTVSINAGGYLIVTFLSDTILMSKDKYAVYYDEVRETVAEVRETVAEVRETVAEVRETVAEVRETVAEALGIKYDEEADPRYLSSIQTSHITGYNTVWNLRNEPVPAIRAGSFLVYKLKEEKKLNTMMIGERTSEGFGLVGFQDASNCGYTSIEEPNKTIEDHSESLICTEYVTKLLAPIIVEDWLSVVVRKAIKGSNYRSVSNTAIGRWKLMMTESLDGDDIDTDSAFADFTRRIESIKTDATRIQGTKLIKDVRRKFFDLSKDDEDRAQCIKRLKDINVSDDEIALLLKSKWPDYVDAVLTDRKYKGGR